jgi:hypothetical protein
MWRLGPHIQAILERLNGGRIRVTRYQRIP